MDAETPYVVMTHHRDGRVLAVMVDGEAYTPQELKAALATATEVDTLRADLAAAGQEIERLHLAYQTAVWAVGELLGELKAIKQTALEAAEREG